MIKHLLSLSIDELNIRWNNCGGSWSEKEDDQLKMEYVDNKLDLIDICDIHKRRPGGVVSRLRKLGIVQFSNQVRGFDEYASSDLRNKLKNAKKPNSNKNITETKSLVKIPESNIRESRSIIRENKNNMFNNYKDDIKEIKNEIKMIKQSISELTDMLKAIYEFEDS